MGIGLAAAFIGVLSLASTPGPRLAACVGALLAIASGLSLVFGLLTPAVGTVVAMEFIAAALFHGNDEFRLMCCGAWEAWLLAVMASAISLLGPGAYSIDARLFGRREIVISSRNPPPDR